MNKVVVVIVIVVIAVAAVLALRSTAMTVHTEMPPNSRLEVDATASWRGETETAPRLAEALTIQCVAETSATARVDSFTWYGDDFTFAVQPALDEPDRKQLKGCLSDLRMPRLIVGVDRMVVV
jgi:hypothetical protein